MSKVILHLVIVGLAIVALPLIFIAAVNSLFRLGIPMSVETWCAAALILLLFSNASIGFEGKGE